MLQLKIPHSATKDSTCHNKDGRSCVFSSKTRCSQIKKEKYLKRKKAVPHLFHDDGLIGCCFFPWWASGPACPNPLGQQNGVYSMIADTAALYPSVIVAFATEFFFEITTSEFWGLLNI